MPTFRIQAPNGETYDIEAPEGATEQSALSHFKMSRNKMKKQEVYSPTEGMSGFDTTMAGIGKGMVDFGRGIGQRLGMVDQKSIDEARRTDQSLMSTTGGNVGNFIGQAIPAAAAMVIPGANTYAGAAMLGGAMGMAQPTATGESAVRNTAEGVGMGLVGQGAGQLLGKGYRAAKAAAEPFYKKGQDAILGRAMNTAANGMPVNMSGELVSGSLPTLGEASNNAGLAAMQRAAFAAVPEVTNSVEARKVAQDMARRGLLDSMADTGKKEFFESARDNAANDLYKKAFAQAPQDRAWIKGQFTQLKKRPAFVDALKEAKTLTANQGLKLDPKNQTQVAHYVKMSLDDQIKNANGNAQRALIDTKNKLLSVIETDKFAPAYGEARATYSAMSQPVNEIDTILAIQKASSNKLTEKLMPSAYANALQDKTAKAATGWKNATLENTLSPEAMKNLQAIKQDLARQNFSDTAGRGVGSDTVQKLAYSNFIDAAGIPTFLQNMSSLQLGGKVLGRGADLAYGGANKEMAERLAMVMLDPKEAKRIMALPQVKNNPELMKLLRGAGGLLGAMSPTVMQPTGLLENMAQ